MNARLKAVVEYARRRSKAAMGWSESDLTAVIAHHMERGSCIDVWLNGAVVGVGLAWRVRRPQDGLTFRVDHDGGDWVFVGLVAAEPGATALMIEEWKRREPGWAELAYCGLRRGGWRIYGVCPDLINRVQKRDAECPRARRFARLEAMMQACRAMASRIVAGVKAQYPNSEHVRADFSPEAPPPRDLGQESRDTLQAQVDLAPALYESEAKFRPKYAQLEMDIARQSLLGTDGKDGLLSLLETIAPRLQAYNATAASRQREADLADVETLGPRATEALLAANPQQKALMDALNAQALAEVESGAAVDPSLAREAAQATRAGQAARGFGYGTNDLAQEVLGRGIVAERLRREKQRFGMQMAGVNQSVAGDPFLAILGRQATVPNQSQALVGQGQGISAQGGPKLFDPFSAYAADLYNTNYNAQAAANIAKANNMTQLAGSAMQAVGGIASAAI